MRFIDEQNNIKTFKPIRVIQRKRHTANVYELPDKRCLKVYNTNNVNEKVQKQIQDLSLGNFFAVQDFLYNSRWNFRGITMPYYEADDTSPILKPTDFILENMEMLRRSAQALASVGIEIWDLHPRNIIWTPEKAIVVDTDDYKYGFSTQSAAYNNEQTITKLLVFILMAEAKKIYPELRDLKLYDYFYSEGIEYISQKLEDYEYPVDYIWDLTR